MTLHTEDDEFLRRIEHELLDGYDEAIELEIHDEGDGRDSSGPIERKACFSDLFRLQRESAPDRRW